jgi:hypothetical protein
LQREGYLPSSLVSRGSSAHCGGWLDLLKRVSGNRGIYLASFLCTCFVRRIERASLVALRSGPPPAALFNRHFSGLVGAGCVSIHSERAATVGLTPAFRYLAPRSHSDEVRDGTAVASTGLSNLVSLSWNASSICLAWAAVKLLLGPITRCAKIAASSAEPISLSSQASWNRVFFSRSDQSSPVR